MKRKRFTQQEIELLRKNPNVKHIKENRLILTFDFRLKLYEKWKKDPTHSTIRKAFTEAGFNLNIIGNNYIIHTNEKFKKFGAPKVGRNKELGVKENFNADKTYDQYLLSTGKFIKIGKGISFSEDFINEIRQDYPAVSVEDQLIKYDIDPKRVGYYRIYEIKRKLERNQGVLTKLIYDDQFIEKYSSHPYVKRCTENQFSLSNQFYNEAVLYSSLHIDRILGIFEINYQDLDVSIKQRIKHKLDFWKPIEPEPIDNSSEIYLKIQRNKNSALIHLIDDFFAELKEKVPSMSCRQKKVVCLWIKNMKHNRYDFSIRTVLKKVGLSKSQYYFILKHDDYGKSEHDKEMQDETDFETIKTVLNSEKYPMGHRMVYMRMKKITGIQFGRRKIMRLMKKYELSSKVRESKESRIEARKLLNEHKKPNLLKREFRLHKPYEVILTDVSYVRYGEGKTAYLSAVKDSVSGRIYTMDISDSNDLTLVQASLEHLSTYELHNALFHSDQGTLYLNDVFQMKLKDLGFIQSMSKRGNCWDNASQESFFGHFKDECRDIINQCSTIEELRAAVEDYMAYYNERRPQWNRNKMTPVEYEEYLLSMTHEEFEHYLIMERQKYDRMMEKAKEKAIARASDLGAGGITHG